MQLPRTSSQATWKATCVTNPGTPLGGLVSTPSCPEPCCTDSVTRAGTVCWVPAAAGTSDYLGTGSPWPGFPQPMVAGSPGT